MSLVCDTLTDASDCANAVKTAGADDNEVDGARALHEDVDRSVGVPGVDSLRPGGISLELFSTGRGDYLERAAVGVREFFGRPKRGKSVGRTINPDDNLARPPRTVVGRIREQGGAGGIVHEFGSSVAERDSQEAATPSTTERQERCRQLVAYTPQNVDRLTAHDACAGALPTADDRFGLAAGFLSLVRKELGEMARTKPRVDRRSCVQRGNSVDHGVVPGSQEDGLAKRLKPPLCSIHPHNNAREQGHLGHIIGACKARLRWRSRGTDSVDVVFLRGGLFASTKFGSLAMTIVEWRRVAKDRLVPRTRADVSDV
jgi:hypothetical protein